MFFKQTFPPKNKGTNSTLLLRNLRLLFFVHFLEESEDTRVLFQNYLTFENKVAYEKSHSQGHQFKKKYILCVYGPSCFVRVLANSIKKQP